MGVQNALTVGVAAATYGLVAGNVIGNPLARRRIKKLGLSSSDAAQVDHRGPAGAEEEHRGHRQAGTWTGAPWPWPSSSWPAGLGTLISMLFAKFNITLAS